MISDAEIEGQTYWMPDCEVGGDGATGRMLMEGGRRLEVRSVGEGLREPTNCRSRKCAALRLDRWFDAQQLDGWCS